MSRLHRVSSPATWSSLKGWTKFRTARASMFRRPARRDLRLTMSPHETAEAAVKVVVPVDEAGEDEARGRANEYLQTVHRSSGSDVAPDDGGAACRRRRVSATAGLRIAAGRLSDDSGRDVLSRREPRSDVVFGDGAARASIRAGTRLEADDVDQFVRMLRYHASVRAGSHHRYCRAGGSGCNQCQRHIPASRTSQSAHIQQG